MLEGFSVEELPAGCQFDRRVGLHRAPAHHYHEIVLRLYRSKIPYEDEARAYGDLGRERHSPYPARDYQREAVEAWHRAGRRGW